MHFFFSIYDANWLNIKKATFYNEILLFVLSGNLLKIMNYAILVVGDKRKWTFQFTLDQLLLRWYKFINL